MLATTARKAYPSGRPELESFLQFIRLPTDLRAMVWEFSLEPRIVSFLPSRFFITRFYCEVHPPVALEVCQDSRKAVRYQYSERFGSCMRAGKILANFRIDTLYLESFITRPIYPFLKRIFRKKELVRLKYVAVDHRLLREDSCGWALRRALQAMPELR
jgi:hypothetical protein